MKLPQNCQFYIDVKGKFSIFAKSSARKVALISKLQS